MARMYTVTNEVNPFASIWEWVDLIRLPASVWMIAHLILMTVIATLASTNAAAQAADPAREFVDGIGSPEGQGSQFYNRLSE